MSVVPTTTSELAASTTATSRSRVAVASLAGLLLLGTLLSGCSRALDAYFANPCDRTVRINTWAAPPAYVKGREPDRQGALPPHSVTKIEEAFVDSPDRQWSYSIDDRMVFPVDGNHWVHQTVVIPATAC